MVDCGLDELVVCEDDAAGAAEAFEECGGGDEVWVGEVEMVGSASALFAEDGEAVAVVEEEVVLGVE